MTDYESKDLTPTLLRNAGYAIGMLTDRCENETSR